jgi:hypothetical protein
MAKTNAAPRPASTQSRDRDVRRTGSNCDWRAEPAVPYNTVLSIVSRDAAADRAATFGGNR